MQAPGHDPQQEEMRIVCGSAAGFRYRGRLNAPGLGQGEGSRPVNCGPLPSWDAGLRALGHTR